MVDDGMTKRQERAIGMLLRLAEHGEAGFGLLMAELSEKQTARTLAELKAAGLVRFTARKTWCPTQIGDAAIDRWRLTH